LIFQKNSGKKILGFKMAVHRYRYPKGFSSDEEETLEEGSGKDDYADEAVEPSDIYPFEMIKIMETRALTVEDVSSLNYTDTLRLASHPNAANFMFENFGIRGVPILSGYSVRPYQIDCIMWMKDREESLTSENFGMRGGILSLTMGLGKTFTSLVHSLSRPKGEYPTLVVVSKSVMLVWRDDIKKFFPPDLKVLYFHRDFMGPKFDKMKRKRILKYELVLTTYDVCTGACVPFLDDIKEIGEDDTMMKGKTISVHLREEADVNRTKNLRGASIIYGVPWNRVIADESQKFANPHTSAFKAMMAIYAKYRWCLSGTPIRNSGMDVFSQLRFLGYTAVTRTVEWKKYGQRTFAAQRLGQYIYTLNYDGAGITLPSKTKILSMVHLVQEEKEVYQIILGAAQKAYDEMMQKLCSYSCVLAMFTRLRQVCIAPYLITAEAKRKDSSDETETRQLKNLKKKIESNADLGSWCHDRDGTAGIYSAKISKCIEIISRIPQGEKIVIFSMFTSCLDLVAHAIDVLLPNIIYSQVDGDTSSEEREFILEDFKYNPEHRAVLFSYGVGSEGFNLTEATHCICIEGWWTEVVPLQAESRIWRSGQTKPVFVHVIRVSGTIEQHMDDICRQKLIESDLYLEGTRKKTISAGPDKYTLGKILGVI
jgi:SNF2 family DNA or RNA helicase